MKSWKKKPEWERRADWAHYDKMLAEAVAAKSEMPSQPEHPRFECQNCKKPMTEADEHKESCNACCDAFTQADLEVDQRREFMLIHGYDPKNPPTYPGDD